MTKTISFLRDQSGATSIEYALIASVIAVVIIGSVNGLGSKLNSTYTTVSVALK